MKRCLYLLCGPALLCIVPVAQSATELPVIPLPKSIQVQDGSFQLGPKITRAVSDNLARAEIVSGTGTVETAHFLANELRPRTSLGFAVKSSDGKRIAKG